MNTEVIVSLITLCGSALGTFAGIAVNSKLTNFRLEQLEKRVGALDHRLKEIESR